MQSLDRAAATPDDDAVFWARLGKLYASIVFKPDRPPKPDETARVNEIFKKAAEHARRDFEERYRLAALATNDAIWDCDLIENTIDWMGKGRVLVYEKQHATA